MDDAAHPPANNSVALHPNGYIEVKIAGDQTYLSFDALRPKTKELTEKLQHQGKDIRGLIDLTEMSSFSSGSNRAAFEILGDITYDRVAMFGANGPITAVTNLVIQALGKGHQTKLFNDRASALVWLLSEDDA